MPAAIHLELPDAPVIDTPTEETSIREEVVADIESRGQVTVHCSYITDHPDRIRIWPTTYLVCGHTGERSQLVHAEGITYAPVWTPVPLRGITHFLLVFPGLPRGCTFFDLVEVGVEDRCFVVRGIERNERDVYSVYV